MFVPSAPNSGHSLVLEISESYRAILQNFIWALGWACEGRVLQVSSESALFYNMSMRPFEGDFNEKQLVSHKISISAGASALGHQRWGIEFMGHNLGTAGTEIPLSSDLTFVICARARADVHPG